MILPKLLQFAVVSPLYIIPDPICPATTRNPYIVLFGFVTVAGFINTVSDVGYKVIPKTTSSGNVAKILTVERTGRTTILLSLSRYSNTRAVIALITVYPIASGDMGKVTIQYLQGDKDTGSYTPKIYYVTESDGSISLYVLTAQSEECGYRVISNFKGNTSISVMTTLPDGATQI